MLTDAEALRTDGLITVILLGQLPTPCDLVEEIGYHLGNGIGSALPQMGKTCLDITVKTEKALAAHGLFDVPERI